MNLSSLTLYRPSINQNIKDMKTTIILFACLLSFNFTFCQTKPIANKSHSGDASTLAAEKDGNFGIKPERIDSVIKIAPNCVVEINNYGWRDTVYDHPYFLKPGITLEEMKATHPRIIFVGFDKDMKAPKTTKKKTHKKGSLYLLAFLAAGSLVYTFKPKRAIR